MKHKFRGMTCVILGCILIVAALGLAGYNLYAEKQAEQGSGRALVQLQEHFQELPSMEEATYEKNPDPILYPEMEMPIIQIDGWEYIGFLEIPELELALPVISQWSYPALDVAPARYAGSAYTKDLVIAAHNYNSHFGRLEDLEEGDEVRFTDVDGNTFIYEAAVIEVLGPNAVEEMESGEWDLSLFTCNWSGNHRITVRCNASESAVSVM